MNTFSLTQIAAILLAASSAAWAVYRVAVSLPSSGAAARFRHFSSHRAAAAQPGRFENSAIWKRWNAHLVWAQRGGHFPGQTLEGVLFRAGLFAGGGGMLILFKPAPLFLLLPFLAFAYPFLQVRSRANAVRRNVVRQLPGITALLAAELSSGASADQAVMRAAGLPGPLPALLKQAADATRLGRPLFSRRPISGMLVEVFSATDLSALRSFALQLDEVAGRGVDGAALMNEAARAYAREYREHVLAEKEKLGGRLTSLVALHFFFPVVMLILMAFLMPLLKVFGGGG